MERLVVDLPGGVGRWVPVVVISVLAIPLAALVAAGLVRRRVRLGVPRSWAWRVAVAEVGMVAGTVPWLWMILTPLPDDGMVHLIPFEDLAGQFQRPALWVFYQVVGNLLVFAAFGFLAPVRWRIRPLWVITIAAAASATVETLQWALHLGRVASIDDVLLNAAGAGLAALASGPWWLASRDRPGSH